MANICLNWFEVKFLNKSVYDKMVSKFVLTNDGDYDFNDEDIEGFPNHVETYIGLNDKEMSLTLKYTTKWIASRSNALDFIYKYNLIIEYKFLHRWEDSGIGYAHKEDFKDTESVNNDDYEKISTDAIKIMDSFDGYDPVGYKSALINQIIVMCSNIDDVVDILNVLAILPSKTLMKSFVDGTALDDEFRDVLNKASDVDVVNLLNLL